MVSDPRIAELRRINLTKGKKHFSLCKIYYSPPNYQCFCHCCLQRELKPGRLQAAGFDLIQLISLPVLMPVPWSFYYYFSVVQFEIRDGDTCSSSIFQDLSSYPGFLTFHMRPGIILPRSVLGFWWRWYWICRLLLVGWTFFGRFTVNPTDL